MRTTLSDRWLHKKYAEYNRRFFGGRLPKTVRLTWVQHFSGGNKNAYARTWSYRTKCGGKNKKEPLHIVVSRRTERVGSAFLLMVLLHEMSHVSTWESCTSRNAHGKPWIKEMRRLAAKGAFDKLW